MAAPENPARKAILRTEMRGILRRLAGDNDAAVRQVRVWLDAHPDLRTIAVYSALPGEVDLLPLIDTNRRWVFPRVSADSLIFHLVRDPRVDLKKGAFNIAEPHVGLPVVAPEEIDAFFCPGLAFSSDGGRLGRGRGFYDRALQHTRPGVLKIGVCFSAQRVQDTFSEPHDIRMNAVISDGFQAD